VVRTDSLGPGVTASEHLQQERDGLWADQAVC
jgi:hypothetical protein